MSGATVPASERYRETVARISGLLTGASTAKRFEVHGSHRPHAS
jgi:hypothetical protein